MILREYPFFVPIDSRRPEEMSAAEAHSYFEWFVGQIPSRIRALRRAVLSNAGELIELDSTQCSLPDLGAWLDQHVTSRSKTAEEIAQDRIRYPGFVWSTLETWTLTDETLSLVTDVGIYFGEVLRCHHPVLRWDLVTKHRRDIDFHRPALFGFATRSHVNPVGLVTSVVVRTLKDEDAAASELPRLFRVWSQHCAGR